MMFKFGCKTKISSTPSPRKASRKRCSRRNSLRIDVDLVPLEIKSHRKFLKLYTITDDVIGSGGTSLVKKCIRNKDHKVFACKIIDKNNLSPKKIQHIREEIDVMSKLQECEHYLHLVNYHESAEKVYIITEYCSGGSLHEYIISQWNSKNYVCQEYVAKLIFKQIIEGIHKLHKQKIVHRDIKAENIVFDINDWHKIKIIDFGLAHVGLNNINGRCGTPHYIAPEILDRQEYTAKVDWWACGILLYCLLSGQYPFYSKLNDRKHLYASILKGKFSFKKTNICPKAQDLITKLLKINPKERIGYHQIINHPYIKNVHL